MSIEQSIHFRASPLEVKYAGVHPSLTFCTIAFGEKNDTPPSGFASGTTLFFSRLEDIETLVAALQRLGNDFAAAQHASERELPAEAYAVEIAKLDATAEQILDL